MTSPVLVLICSGSEWREVKKFHVPTSLFVSPFGEYFLNQINDRAFIFIQSGVGKVSAAAASEHAVLRFAPQAVVNLGTCGGIGGLVQVGDILLAQRTVIYDIHELMGDAAAAVARYTSDLDLSWLPQPPPLPVITATLVSADSDLRVESIPGLRQQYGALGADWESGALAWVAQRHNLPCLILRGVTDLVSAEGGEAYGNIEHYHRGTSLVMPRLLSSLPAWFAA